MRAVGPRSRAAPQPEQPEQPEGGAEVRRQGAHGRRSSVRPWTRSSSGRPQLCGGTSGPVAEDRELKRKMDVFHLRVWCPRAGEARSPRRTLAADACCARTRPLTVGPRGRACTVVSGVRLEILARRTFLWDYADRKVYVRYDPGGSCRGAVLYDADPDAYLVHRWSAARWRRS